MPQQTPTPPSYGQALIDPAVSPPPYSEVPQHTVASSVRRALTTRDIKLWLEQYDRCTDRNKQFILQTLRGIVETQERYRQALQAPLLPPVQLNVPNEWTNTEIVVLLSSHATTAKSLVLWLSEP